MAANSGVHVEKTFCHNPREARLMIEAGAKNKIVMQVGTQSHSTAHVMGIVKKLRSAIIGNVSVAQVIAAYERNLMTPDSPFDRFISSDKSAIAPNQQRGMEVF